MLPKQIGLFSFVTLRSSVTGKRGQLGLVIKETPTGIVAKIDNGKNIDLSYNDVTLSGTYSPAHPMYISLVKRFKQTEVLFKLYESNPENMYKYFVQYTEEIYKQYKAQTVTDTIRENITEISKQPDITDLKLSAIVELLKGIKQELEDLTRLWRN